MIRPRCRYCQVFVPNFGDICHHCQEADVQNDDLIRLIDMDIAALRARPDDD